MATEKHDYDKMWCWEGGFYSMGPIYSIILFPIMQSVTTSLQCPCDKPRTEIVSIPLSFCSPTLHLAAAVCVPIFTSQRDASVFRTAHFHLTFIFVFSFPFPIHPIFQFKQSQSHCFAPQHLPSRFQDQPHHNTGVCEGRKNAYWYCSCFPA